MLKKVFRQGKEFQKKVVQLFNLLNNKLEDLVNNFDKKNIIGYRLDKSVTSPQLLTI